MSLQTFESIPDDKRLAMMADLLRYENAAQKTRIAELIRENDELKAQLTQAAQELEELQQVVDLQNAEWHAGQQDG